MGLSDNGGRAAAYSPLNGRRPQVAEYSDLPDDFEPNHCDL